MMYGCLILHGLTGNPATVSTLREAFLAADFRVSTPCLAGHGSTIEDLARSGWQDWYATVRISYNMLRKETDRVFCAGISLGALLAMKLALDEGWGIRAMVLISTPLKLSRMERIAIPIIRKSPLRAVIKRIPKDFEKSVADPEGRMYYERLSLSHIPMNAVFALSDLQNEILSQIHRLSNPILLLHGKDDRVAPPSNVDIIKNSVSSDIVESIIFKKSRHVLTMDSERSEVANSAVDFCKRFM